jgi:hypothetical protein
MTNYTTTSTAAALRTHGAPSFVVSAGMSTWSSAAPANRALGTAVQGLRLTVDIPNPMVDRTRVATKQDRPPRGVPR